MKIVRVVAVGVFAGWMLVCQVLLIDVSGLLILFRRFVVLSDPHVNVRGHMDEMTSSRHEVRQPLRARQG